MDGRSRRAGWRLATRVAGRANGGAHGYDPTLKSMHGLFVAAGPRVREGVRAPAFENIHVYDFLCALLELKPAPNDGDPSVTEEFLRRIDCADSRARSPAHQSP